MSRAPGSSLPPWTLDRTTFFFCCSLTLGVKVLALANRRKSIAWRLLLFRPFFHASLQYVQPLTVRPHLYMNAAAPLYHRTRRQISDDEPYAASASMRAACVARARRANIRRL